MLWSNAALKRRGLRGDGATSNKSILSAAIYYRNAPPYQQSFFLILQRCAPQADVAGVLVGSPSMP